MGAARAAAAGISTSAGFGVATEPTSRIEANSMTTAASGHAHAGAVHHISTGARRHSHTAQPRVAKATRE